MIICTMELVGFKELFDELKTLEPKVARPILNAALRSGAKDVKALAEVLVPVRTGALKRSLKIKSKRSNKLGTVSYLVETGEKFFKGATYYGGFVEFGTKKWAGMSFVRKSFDLLSGELLNKIKKVLADGLNKYKIKQGAK